MLSTEVSAPSTPSNTRMRRQVDIQQSCDGCDATAYMAVAMAPTRETPRHEVGQRIKTMSLLIQPKTKPRQVQNQHARHPETVLPFLWENRIDFANDTE